MAGGGAVRSFSLAISLWPLIVLNTNMKDMEKSRENKAKIPCVFLGVFPR